MSKRSRCGIIVTLGVLCVILFCVCGCAKSPRDSDSHQLTSSSGSRLDSVVASSIRMFENPRGILIGFRPVIGAKQYEISAGSSKVISKNSFTFLSPTDGFALPASGRLIVSIVAKADGYLDSEPTQSSALIAEGVTLQKPQFISCNNGIVEWTPVIGVRSYLLKVGGKFVSDSNDGYYHSNKYDANALAENSVIQVTACGDGVWFKDGQSVTAMYVPAQKALVPAAVSDVAVQGDKLLWKSVDGVKSYNLVDMNYNVINVSDTTYNMSGKNLILGVYPAIESPIVGSALVPCAIPYLAGAGTLADPYQIKSHTDLRAIDYYEHLYELAGGNGPRNYYKITRDIDYGTVAALESESNIYSLRKPFYGTLDGNGKKLSNINVNYDGGYWSLFDYLTVGSVVKNIIFDHPTIVNKLQSVEHPSNASIATIANTNYGTIQDIQVRNAAYTAAGGEVSGIAAHNFGTISGCSVGGEFVQGSTGVISQACYEMAGIALENRKGGKVIGNVITSLTIRGSKCTGSDGGTYNNVRTAAGIVAVNRVGGEVANNSFTTLIMVNMLDNYRAETSGFEWGGIVAYNAGTLKKGNGTLGSFSWNSGNINLETGSATDQRGKLYGKNDGQVVVTE